MNVELHSPLIWISIMTDTDWGLKIFKNRFSAGEPKHLPSGLPSIFSRHCWKKNSLAQKSAFQSFTWLADDLPFLENCEEKFAKKNYWDSSSVDFTNFSETFWNLKVACLIHKFFRWIAAFIETQLQNIRQNKL